MIVIENQLDIYDTTNCNVHVCFGTGDETAALQIISHNACPNINSKNATGKNMPMLVFGYILIYLFLFCHLFSNSLITI